MFQKNINDCLTHHADSEITINLNCHTRFFQTGMVVNLNIENMYNIIYHAKKMNNYKTILAYGFEIC